jgi:NitT/TauT family transport system permease protein
VIGAVVGEFVSGFAGEQAPLGIVILAALREARTDLVFAAVGLSAVVGFLLFGAVSAGGWLALRRWHPSAS